MTGTHSEVKHSYGDVYPWPGKQQHKGQKGKTGVQLLSFSELSLVDFPSKKSKVKLELSAVGLGGFGGFLGVSLSFQNHPIML